MTSSSSQPLILEYSKRRYDGGPEKELIEQIEMQYQIYEQQRAALGLGHGSPFYSTPPVVSPYAGYPVNSPGTPDIPVPDPNPVKKMSLGEKLYKAFVMPYVELVLGLSGVLIGNIMIVTLMKGAAINPDVLAQERKALVHHSWQVVRTSVLSILLSPFAALKLLFQ